MKLLATTLPTSRKSTHRAINDAMKTEEEKIADAREAEQKIESALEKHGVGHFWAKLIASLIITAIAIAVSFFATSCSVTYTKLPDGTVQAHGGVVLPQRVQTVTK